MIRIFAGVLVAALRARSDLVLENLALRQQLPLYKHVLTRPVLRPVDRAFWAVLSQVWNRWREALCVVTPGTVVRWHRAGFCRFWTWRCRRTGGRPPVDAEIRSLIRQLARENPLWGAPRIHGELKMLGYDVSERTVARYLPKRSADVTDVAELSAQSREGSRRDRLLHGAVGDVPAAAGALGARGGVAEDPALQRDRAPDGAMDESAARAGVRLC